MDVTNLRTAAGGSILMAGSALPVGTKMPIKVDISSDDFPITVPLRMITAVTGTVIVVEMKCIEGTTRDDVSYIPGLPCFNITKIKKIGTNCTCMEAWPLE